MTCPRCQGKVIADGYGELVCLLCGRNPQPKEPLPLVDARYIQAHTYQSGNRAPRIGGQNLG